MGDTGIRIGHWGRRGWEQNRAPKEWESGRDGREVGQWEMA